MVDENIPRDAATVILTRDGIKGRLEVYLMRRHRDQAFMGGAFVFPGGSIDDCDSDPALASCILGLNASEAADRLQEPELTAPIAFGLYMTAIRETFEEAGVLLAYQEKGGVLQFTDREVCCRYSEARRDIYEKRFTLKELAQREKICFAFDLLTPYAHWITPAIEKRRFNTRFFLARIPDGQIPLHDSIEMTESRWMSPTDVLVEHRGRRMLLMPPTLKTMEELSLFDTTEALFLEAEKRRIYPILPHVYQTGDTFVLLLPHDRDYSIDEYRQPARPGDHSRMVFCGGIWQTESQE
jgi:8-oxo-dGTP pyrophosphatase MutT (NUDIX family)